jgi:DNA-binding transcriptional MocR family regulator
VGRDDPHVEGLVQVAEQVAPPLALLIPDFHNPTGHLLGNGGRERIADRLRKQGTVTIVDESMVELELDGLPMPRPLGSFLTDAITVG